MKVLVVYDACFSGSFMQALKEETETRVIIPSTDNDEVAYFLDLKQSFSGMLWDTLSGKTGMIGNLYNAWTLASNNMANYQEYYYRGQIGVKQDCANYGAGFEVMTSDGKNSFRMPLGTTINSTASLTPT